MGWREAAWTERVLTARWRGGCARDRIGCRYRLVALTYYVAGEIGLRLSLVGHSVTPLWPPTGVAVVALLALGSRTWPAVTIAAVAINVPLGPTVPAALLIAVGNTVAPLAAVALLKAVQFRIDLARVRDAAALVLLGALAAMAISATVGTLALLWSGAIAGHHFAGAWSVWWTGDAMGVLIVAPFLWSLAHHTEHRKRRPSWEVIAAAGALFVVCGIVMAADLPLWFVIVPVLGVIAWRFGQRGAARADLVVSVIATIVAARELGVFQGMSLVGRMITLQSFNATVVFTSLLLAAAVSQRADIAAVQRDAVETLQRSLLPDRLCEVPGLELAARYIPANDQVELGGDWYDVFSLHDGRYGVVIGDVAGHGILAAAIMGKIRTALRAFASDGSSPGTALERLNSLLGDLREGATATVWYGQYDPSSHLLVFTNAGHVPPLVVDAHGAQYLEDVHGPPVGALDRTHFGESCSRSSRARHSSFTPTGSSSGARAGSTTGSLGYVRACRRIRPILNRHVTPSSALSPMDHPTTTSRCSRCVSTRTDATCTSSGVPLLRVFPRRDTSCRRGSPRTVSAAPRHSTSSSPRLKRAETS